MNRITQQVSTEVQPALDRLAADFRARPDEWDVLFKVLDTCVGQPVLILSATFRPDPRYSMYTLMENLS